MSADALTGTDPFTRAIMAGAAAANFVGKKSRTQGPSRRWRYASSFTSHSTRAVAQSVIAIGPRLVWLDAASRMVRVAVFCFTSPLGNSDAQRLCSSRHFLTTARVFSMCFSALESE